MRAHGDEIIGGRRTERNDLIRSGAFMGILQNASDRDANILMVVVHGGVLRKRSCSPRRISAYRAIGLPRDARYWRCVVVLQGKGFFVYVKSRLDSLPDIQFQRMEPC